MLAEPAPEWAHEPRNLPFHEPWRRFAASKGFETRGDVSHVRANLRLVGVENLRVAAERAERRDRNAERGDRSGTRSKTAVKHAGNRSRLSRLANRHGSLARARREYDED